ncbi:trypsin-like peptidase domain-containing protein [Streptomyces antarcticus]|uniref:VMAP-C domain-containing protein n=1 Tax=Streptomyces antarcticus TaxID=2996458 RepID=UPI00226E434C|nr:MULTISPECIES: trypsin-like peptidase domain-containing protein [unclassified Streptomyces]MCY0942018.1 trypsin-like peptidase domain-containing protein [Streptomyces sp. H34-AA3]MCZ4081964.1 trypsin-like peptidase domain-containing protein [Streptomyces sp. H34-S5]
MGSESWQVRVGAGSVGSGFLVTDRHVMTCAHVVAGAERAEVTFAQYPDLGSFTASVIVGGDWHGEVRGDVAVLELERPVNVTPARFAAVDAPYAHPLAKLTAYGFPQDYDEGILGEFRSASDQLIAGEWVQLESWTDHGQPLEEGFSGAAVVREDTGEVVGMVTAKHERGGGGRMLPSRVLVRHWPGAAGLVPVRDHSPEAVARLRDLVQGCVDDRAPEAVYRSVMGPLAPLPPVGAGFLSLWDVAWFLLTEVTPAPGTAPWADFAAHLADRTQDPAVRSALYQWAGDHRSGTAPQGPGNRPVPGDGGAKWSPILVEIERSGADHDAYLVSVYAIRGGRSQLVASNTLAKGRVREYVSERLDHAFRQIDRSGDELIAFALPRDWLGEPVDEWHTSAEDPTPLGCSHPVVVMDLGRRRQSRLQFMLDKAWQTLERSSGTAWHRVECGSAQDPTRLTVRLSKQATAVGYGAPPETDQARGLLLAGLNAAVPVMVWQRSICSGRHGGDATAERSCVGARFLDALQERLTSLSPADLPGYVRELRREAYEAEEPEPHWAAGLALVWEDPRWFPEANVYSQSPVS